MFILYEPRDFNYFNLANYLLESYQTNETKTFVNIYDIQCRKRYQDWNLSCTIIIKINEFNICIESNI